ncbi:MAG: LamG domain-containing protein, partial [Anaerolineae bacterium]
TVDNAPNSNPAITEFAIAVDDDGDGSVFNVTNYVQADGTIGASAVWQDEATWGAKVVTGLSASTLYRFQVKARNGDDEETNFSAEGQGTTSAGPIAHWTFDEGSGQTAADSSGNGHTGTLGATTGAESSDPAWWACTVGGSVLSFDGSDAFVATSSVDLSGTDKMTTAFWWNPTVASTGADVVVEMGPDPNTVNGVSMHFMEAERMELFTNGDVGYNTWRTPVSPIFSPGTWYHIVAVFDRSLSSSEVTGYVDGVLTGATAFDADNTNNFSNQPFYFGGRAGSSLFFNGLLDDVRVYDRVLTAGEISALAASAPTGCSNPAPTAPTSLFTHDTDASSGDTNPILSGTVPRFSAIYNDPDLGDIANGYSIQVDDNSDFSSPIWDSDQTAMANCSEGNRCVDIVYAGSSLVSATQYYWRVRFYDDEGNEGNWSAGSGANFFEYDFSPISVKTGTYTGNGTSQSITGLGFQPDAVIVKRRGISHAFIRTSTMPSTKSKYIALAINITGEGITSLDVDGFTVGNKPDVNLSAEEYHWIAFKASAGSLDLGNYVGNGTGQTISGVGFQPEWVMVFPAVGLRSVQKTASMPAADSTNFDTGLLPDRITGFTADGFTVGTDAEVSESGMAFHYMAFNATAANFAEGSYEGDGLDDRSIAVGFKPQYVVVTPGETTEVAVSVPAPVYRPESLTGDGSLNFRNSSSTHLQANTIQALETNGFQVGSNAAVNADTKTFYWVAIKANPTTLYRSVGIDNTDLNTGQTVEIAGTTATFSASMADKIGVGDVLEYGSTNLAFISGRTSNVVYTVASATGGTPVAASAGTAVSVFRAYTSLFNWEVQDENDAIADGVENFDTATDLVAANTVMQVAGYADGPDTSRLQIVGWNT